MLMTAGIDVQTPFSSIRSDRICLRYGLFFTATKIVEKNTRCEPYRCIYRTADDIIPGKARQSLVQEVSPK